MLDLLADAATTQSTQVWLNVPVSPEKLLIWIAAVGSIATAAVIGFFKVAGIVREQWFDSKKKTGLAQVDVDTAIELARIASAKEIEKARADNATLARGLNTLIEANKQNPTTPDLVPEDEARIKQIANAPPTAPPANHAPTPEQIQEALKDK